MATSMLILAIISMILWILVSRNLMATSKTKSKGSMYTLFSASVISTVFLLVIIFRKLQIF
ncbi:hypothetical protein BFR34_00585 [Brochothrix thermosphacta DSM 20171 = FSL F6-1036]|nr:hypothetical protein BTHER_11356 [Brochothrix thermosphacta DSM 20171 = FSL F6-1036]ODJ51549.1 hypothetical protein BFR34_00585 [Brochothrix thermosphacta DSM 20171 = FSL F6-1036]